MRRSRVFFPFWNRQFPASHRRPAASGTASAPAFYIDLSMQLIGRIQIRSLRNAVSEFPQPIKRLVCESVGNNGSNSRAPDTILLAHLLICIRSVTRSASIIPYNMIPAAGNSRYDTGLRLIQYAYTERCCSLSAGAKIEFIR